MYRFLLSRRWIGFALFVVVLAVAFVQLGRWQFHRLAERRQDNAIITHNLRAAPTPVQHLVRVGGSVPARLEWRLVEATGRFDVSRQLLVRYQTRDGSPGVDVVTPLITSGGAAVLVDRGWVSSTNDANDVPHVPPPPRGQVTATGWLQPDQEGDPIALEPVNSQVRLISSRAIAHALPYPVYSGYVQLTGLRPAPATPLARPLPPDLSSGPHFFYGLQWFFFALLAIGGCLYFAWSEAAERRRTAARAPVAAPRTPEDATTG